MQLEVFVQLGVTLLLTYLQDPNETGKRRKMFLKVFRAIGNAFKADAEFRAAANEAFK